MRLTVLSLCIDQVLETNFLEKVTNSPDYRDMPVDEAMVDLRWARADSCVGHERASDVPNARLRPGNASRTTRACTTRSPTMS